MLMTHKNLNTLLGAIAATLALTISIPYSGSIALTSAASAGEGGGSEALMERMSRYKKKSGFNRRSLTKKKWAKKKRSTKRRSALRKGRKKYTRKSVKRRSRTKTTSKKFGWYVLDPGYVYETRDEKMNRMIEEKLRKEVARKQHMKKQIAEFYIRQQYKHFINNGLGGQAAPNPPVQPVAAPIPNRSTDWASSYNPYTRITTTSVRNVAGGHTVTLTDRSGAVVNQFDVSY